MPRRHSSNLETWFLEHAETVLRNQPAAPRTPDCVREDFLVAFASSAQKFPLADPRVQHVSSCSHCMHRFLELRDELKSSQHGSEMGMWRKRWVLATSLVVACFVVGLISVVLIERSLHRPAAQLEMAQIERTVDLSSYGTFRGTDTIPLREVSLPAALVRLQIVLPRLSNQGNYTVTVSRDREGNDTVARAQGVATGSDPRTVLTVTLDLRTARPGRYFLSTERESDGGAYYYPLEIRN